MEKDVMENISIRLEDLHPRPLDAIWINTARIGVLMTNSYRVLSVGSVDIIVYFIVFLEVVILTWVELWVVLLVIPALTMYSCMDLSVVNKRTKNDKNVIR